MNAKKEKTDPGSGKKERYIQPSLLMGLLLKPSYGYELINSIQQFGFIQGQAPPGMIYRHLRQLEESGLVVSKWKTEGTGAAKRMYEITQDGEEALTAWVEYMKEQVVKLEKFIGMYTGVEKRQPS